ncbi:MAG: hypothetical protein AABZ60_07520 [Planctomycetota bacterium]
MLSKSLKLMLSSFLCMVSFSLPRAQEKTLGKVIVTISVDWEGRSLSGNNLNAMVGFRKRFKTIPLTHFFNAAYFTRQSSPALLLPRIKRTMEAQDEIGLHIHCWRSLVLGSGVSFLREPTFWGPLYELTEFQGDLGHEVELDAYELQDIRKIVQNSTKIIQSLGFQVSSSFRCGGWLASPKVLEAIRAEGFLIDSSATDRRWHQDEISEYLIYERMGELWKEVTAETQPFFIETKAGSVLEMPDTGALADYITAEEMNQHLAEALKQVTPDTRRFVHLGFHQETAEEYLPRLITTLEQWQSHPDLYFCTLEKAAQLVKESLAPSAETKK